MYWKTLVNENLNQNQDFMLNYQEILAEAYLNS